MRVNSRWGSAADLPQCCYNSSSPHPPSALHPPASPEHSPAREGAKGRQRTGVAREQRLQSTFLSLASMSHRQPSYLGPSLLHLPTLTLSPSDRLSRWASSGQQPQQHIPTQTLPSSMRPWHCLALLSWRQPVPAPGLRLVRMEGQGLLSSGACSLDGLNRLVCFFVLLSQVFLRSSHQPPSYRPARQQNSPSPHLSTKKRAHYSTVTNTQPNTQGPFLLWSVLCRPVSRALLSHNLTESFSCYTAFSSATATSRMK